MALTYRFKREPLAGGGYVYRSRILVKLKGRNGEIFVPALLDSGCDVTVIPECIATAIGLDMNGIKSQIYGFREANDVVKSRATIKFIGKEHRLNQVLDNIPVLIVSEKPEDKPESEIVLGIEGIFDSFEIIFKKSQNKITFKRVEDMPKKKIGILRE